MDLMKTATELVAGTLRALADKVRELEEANDNKQTTIRALNATVDDLRKLVDRKSCELQDCYRERKELLARIEELEKAAVTTEETEIVLDGLRVPANRVRIIVCQED